MSKKVDNSIDFSKSVLFLSEPLSVLYGNTLGYSEYTVLEYLIQICKELDLNLSVNFHPKDTESFRYQYHEYSVQENIRELSAKYSMTIGMVTMGLLHVYLYGGRIVSFQPGLNGHDMCITTRLGVSESIFDKDFFKIYLRNREISTIRKMDELGGIDGKSVNRLLTLIKKFAVV